MFNDQSYPKVAFKRLQKKKKFLIEFLHKFINDLNTIYVCKIVKIKQDFYKNHQILQPFIIFLILYYAITVIF